MEKIDKKNGKRHQEKILNLIKQKDTSLAELKKNTTRQSVLYHIPKLCEENLIRAYIKGNGLKDEDVFYTLINRYEYPQDILKLINEMCESNKTVVAQKFQEFINLCESRFPTIDAKRLAFALMADIKPGLKEKVAFVLCEGYGDLELKDFFELDYLNALNTNYHIRNLVHNFLPSEDLSVYGARYKKEQEDRMKNIERVKEDLKNKKSKRI